ncbi:MAG TPA: RNA polymerase factor sigma-54 [Thiotrichaceae bacterium]|jgi:RNA polymerase sigma-54 factor|nr:RNA polymerase factor sigma-54 [Thiotrichaceae bacterium]HIM07591.1 RNA polymerase factor sigma-54 [Gammaproteobacteria bacterium]
MKASLQLRIGQSLTMTPQLQQAIRLLQLSSIELQAEVQDALESNMMLEVDEGEAGQNASSEENPGKTEEVKAESSEQPEPSDQVPEMNQETIPDELPVDSGWDDVYDSTPSFTKTSSGDNNYDGFENQDTSEKTLREHIKWQLNLTPASDADKVIAMTIVDSLDDDGYLTESLEDILATIGDDLAEEEVGIEEVEAVLRMIQSMDPVGVASRDIKECLSLQLNHCEPDTHRLEEAKKLVANYLDLLAGHDYNRLMRKMKLDKAELTEVVALIQSMNPRPGNQVSDARTEYVIPDVYVKKIKGVWKVDLNTDSIPSLKINSVYANMIRRADNSHDNNSLKNHLQEARWFIKSIRSRSETLLRVTTCIVERQRPFLDYGEEAMKPLVLHDVAETLGMHESTISRVTTRKYMHTPRGIFELKYFFSSHVSTSYGGACSSTAIRAMMKKLVRAETPDKPLSDSKIAAILEDQGINVARRTVAKYREAMAIPPSNERKRLA